MIESQKLDFILNNMVTKEDMANMATKEDIANMATKEDIANMATKEDIANMATKEDIANMATKDDIVNMATKDDIANLASKAELFELENNVLSEIDIVQEKANNHFERLGKRLDMLETTMTAIKLEVSTIHLVNKSIIDLQDRVEIIEKRIS